MIPRVVHIRKWKGTVYSMGIKLLLKLLDCVSTLLMSRLLTEVRR